MDFEVLEFWILIFFIIAAPGPINIFIVGTSLQNNWKYGFIALTGVFASNVIWASIAWSAVSFTKKYTEPLNGIGVYLTGAIILILGISMLFERPAKRHSKLTLNFPKAITFSKGASLDLFNPTPILLYTVIYPQYAGGVHLDRFLVMFFGQTIIAYVTVGIMIFAISHATEIWLHKYQVFATKAFGIALIIIGIIHICGNIYR